MGFRHNHNTRLNLHRWEQTPGEQKCLRCGVVRRVRSGAVFYAGQRSSSKVYEYSSDREKWTELVECAPKK